MRVEVFTRNPPTEDSKYERAFGIANEIVTHLESTQISPISNIATSKQIRDAVAEYMKKGSWIPDFKFNSSIPDSEPNTNYRIDFIKDIAEPSDKQIMRILFEACFDNRQAIGTNVLKFELATRVFERHENRKAIPIMLVADKRSLKKYGWDGSIGSFEEYELALRDPYSDLLSINPIFLVVRD